MDTKRFPNLKGPAPLFTLYNVEGEPVSLAADLKEHQFILLVFLRHQG